MEMDRNMAATKIEAAGGSGVQEAPARTIKKRLERDMAQTNLPMVEPLKVGTPTGLFDCQGALLREGDLLRIANSPVPWIVRFNVESGFMAHMCKDNLEIIAPLDIQPRAGKLIKHQWLKDVTKVGGEVSG